ncbi:sugar-binding protein [Fictibacillus sp. KU28468]|uniref:sugar-binding protein n=1 Tax=Fictibacillus sp. KU28468 TaxID=2991053 RepID=UPI0008ED9FCC|nr:sugar-binding protein [Fictibacillus sp. KU28468]UZJ76916.1 sugar-binding protein [Fictibacillus sp. KU28468]SFD92933.1 monosaccharide ABC transporter substrate-binding protein, CUT2 family [Bacillus sp. OV194]
MGLKKIGLSIFIAIFFLNAGYMLFFGRETFQVKPSAAQTPKYLYHFVLISEEIDNEYWRLVEKGAKTEADKRHIHLDYLGPKQANNEEQLTLIDKAIAGKVDGIMTQGLSNEKFNYLVNKSVQKGIPLLTVDTDAPDSERQVYVGSDNYRAGKLAGEELVKNTQGKQKVGIVTGRLDASNQKLRVKGFEDVLAKHKRIQVAGIEESNITKSGALQATYELLKNDPDITAFFGTSALDGIGISQVTSQYQSKNKPFIISFDTLPETMTLIRTEQINATVGQYPYQMGEKAVRTLLSVKKGKLPQPLQYTKTDIIKKTKPTKLWRASR